MTRVVQSVVFDEKKTIEIYEEVLKKIKGWDDCTAIFTELRYNVWQFQYKVGETLMRNETINYDRVEEELRRLLADGFKRISSELLTVDKESVRS